MLSLLGLKELSASEIEDILRRAQEMQDSPQIVQGLLSETFITNLFFENSTRTRFSFEVAEKKLGAEVLNFQENVSSTQKGETLYDTLRTLEAMGVQAAVIRHSKNGIIQELNGRLGLSLISAGVGYEEHPTQALLDLLTIRQEFGTFLGLNVAIIGDLQHSRVLRSNVYGLKKLGAHVIISGPERLQPEETEIREQCEWLPIDEAIQEADVVMMLRIQLERHHEALQIDPAEYHHAYGLTVEREQKMKSHAIIMHPAPFNRDVEIASALVESERSRIFKQIHNGVAVRMAALERACKPTHLEPAVSSLHERSLL